MSEQNPPSGQPTPPPSDEVEGAGPTPDEQAAPPPPADETAVDEPVAVPADAPAEPVAAEGADTPPPPSDGDTTAVGAYPPPAEKKSKRTPIVIGVAILLVLVLVGAAVAVIVGLSGPDKHSIAIPSTAGGMKRDPAKETEFKQQLAAAEAQVKTQVKDASYVKSGVYNQADSKKGPQGALVFLGAKLSKPQTPSSFVSTRFEKQAKSNGFTVTKLTMTDGAKGACASQGQGSQSIAICAWATRDTVGELIPTTPGWTSDKLGKILVSLRKDVEKKE